MKHSFTMFLWEKLPVSVFISIFTKNLFPDQYLMNLPFMNRKLKFVAAVSPVEEKLFQRQFSGTNQMIFWWFKKDFDTVLLCFWPYCIFGTSSIENVVKRSLLILYHSMLPWTISLRPIKENIWGNNFSTLQRAWLN